MSWTPAAFLIKNTALRRALRQFGVVKPLSTLVPLVAGRGYEARVDETLRRLVRAGDTVWDVGANVGLYTERFATAVGNTGHVVAFEPVEASYAELRRRVSAHSNVIVRMEALGSERASVKMLLNEDPTSPTNSLARTCATPNACVQRVSVVTVDQLVLASQLPTPNVVKVDTEGFEEEVIWGMRATLRSPELRALMIEVHFSVLDEHGYRRAPDRISSLLLDAGFALRWVDASHLLAHRPDAGR